MKTKIVYISGNEIFDIHDIRSAFDEVRNALNLDRDTVLFGVPVDNEDAGIMPNTTQNQPTDETTPDIKETTVSIQSEIINEPIIENIPSPIESIEPQPENESISEKTPKKRGRPRKETVVEEVIEPIVEDKEPETVESVEEQPIMDVPETTDEDTEKVVPILSVLSTNESDVVEQDGNIDIIPSEILDDKVENQKEESPELPDDDEAGLEKLLSAMTPLQEDIMEDKVIPDTIPEPTTQEDISVDMTLEQLATEFAENQDKIASATKSSTRSKIGKLRNILPFKQSKHKDQGLGDLFGWAGVAANDEDFSVPGFFTNVASKK